MRLDRARKMLIFWTLFIGIGAVMGAGGMLYDPTGKFMGMDALLPYFKVLPFADILFQNYTFSGISLFIVNGLTQLITAYMLIKRKALASRFSIGCGVILMLWICIQFYMFPMNFMSAIYFIFGLIEAVTGAAMHREECVA